MHSVNSYCLNDNIVNKGVFLHEDFALQYRLRFLGYVFFLPYKYVVDLLYREFWKSRNIKKKIICLFKDCYYFLMYFLLAFSPAHSFL
jgi:hypothetical protein